MRVLQPLRRALFLGRAATQSFQKARNASSLHSSNGVAQGQIFAATPISSSLSYASVNIADEVQSIVGTASQSVSHATQSGLLEPPPAHAVTTRSSPDAPVLLPISLPGTQSKHSISIVASPRVAPDADADGNGISCEANHETHSDLVPQTTLASPTDQVRYTLQRSLLADPPYTRQPLTAANALQAFLSLSTTPRTPFLRLDLTLPVLVPALLNLHPADLINVRIQQPGGDAYTITGYISCGAMGWIMEARRQDGRQVAVKIHNKVAIYCAFGNIRHQLVQEARIQACITEMSKYSGMSGLAGSLASWSDLYFDYTVMELYPRHLGQWAEECPPHKFPFNLAAAEMLAGLSHFHAMGFIHCDVKPANVLVSSEGHFALADFGLAQRVHRGAVSEECGTPGYYAPEVLCDGLFGQAGFDQRADVWSLGLVFLEIYDRYRGPTYPGDDSVPARLTVFTRDPLRMDSMRELRTRNPVLYDLLSKMLVRDPRERWTSHQLKRHEYFKGVPWNDLQYWAETNNLVTSTPEYIPVREVSRGGGPTDAHSHRADLTKIIRLMQSEEPQDRFDFCASP